VRTTLNDAPTDNELTSIGTDLISVAPSTDVDIKEVAAFEDE